MKQNNRSRILESSVSLFNQAGVVAVTTNHISQELGISPGNLYFHFRNKEEIIRELFDQMCKATYDVWRNEVKHEKFPTPLELIERSMEVFWSYRFFHREMYHLRRKDPLLARKWRSHIAKTMRLLQATYGHWVKLGVMHKIADPHEMQMISDVVLITSSSSLQFFESQDKPASRKPVKSSVRHIARFLLPFHTPEYQAQIQDYLKT